MFLQRQIDNQTLTGKNKVRWYDDTDEAAYPIPTYGAHDLQPAFNRRVWHPLKLQRGAA